MTALPRDVREARERLHARLASLLGTPDVADVARLDEALTHPSYANEARAKDNQRLEFLGDAVLGLCVSELLSEAHPDADEGTLTRLRAALVNAGALAEWARAEELGACLALGRGARNGGEREQTNVLADAVEAVVAAVYLARGHEGARAIVREVVRTPMAEMGPSSGRDPKSVLQERVQATGEPAPSYVVVGTSGPRHEPRFEVEVRVGERVLGRGAGRSKRLAERDAAANALTHDASETASSETSVAATEPKATPEG